MVRSPETLQSFIMQSEIGALRVNEKTIDPRSTKVESQVSSASGDISLQDDATNATDILSGIRLFAVVVALMLTILCVALDNTSQ